MKKLILLGLVTIGITVGTTTSQAGSVSISVGRPYTAVVFPSLPIFVPPPVMFGGCVQPLIVHDTCRDVRVERRVVVERRDRFFHHGRL